MIALKTSIEDRKDPAFEKIIKELQRLVDSYVTIGVHDDAGEYDDGQSVVMVALWNEFGTETSPERSFLRSAIDKNVSQINDWRDEAILNIIEGGWTAAKALEMVGFRIQVLIQNMIQSDVPPPNVQSTAEQKIRDGVPANTLQWTKTMLRSVTYKVVMQ